MSGSPPRPPRPPRPSAFMRSGDMAARAAEHEERLAGAVQRAAIGQLLAGGPFAEFLHLVLALFVAAIVWDVLPVEQTIGWIAAVAAAAGLRTGWRWRARRRQPSDEEALAGIRLTVVAIGLAWGVGAAAAIPELPFHDAALILVVLSGIVAGATSTLVGDRRSFQYLLVTVLVPIPVGIILLPGYDRSHLIAVALVALFAWGMSRIHARAHRTFAERMRTATLLESSSEELTRQHAYLDGLLASAPVAIAVVDGGGVVQGSNPHFEILFGYTSAEAVGRDINALIVTKSEAPKAGQIDRRVRRGDTVVLEVERRRKDGTMVPVRLSARRVEGTAEDHVFVMYEDISDRRRAQDALTQLASIVETSEDAIIGQTLDGNVITWNAAAQRMFGYTLGDIQGKHVTLLAPPDRAGEVHAILERIRRGDHIEHFETVRLRKDGTPVPVSISISVTRDAAGRISGFSTIARDVREEVATREALRQARDAAERLAQTRSSFLANMSHEIRTPLNAVLGLTELLLNTELAPEQRHSLSLVQVAGETLLTLLNDILDLSKIEAEQVRLESIPFGPTHLVETTIGLLTGRARQKRLELLADVAAEVPPMVRGDPTRLRQVLTNLVGNAIKFTESGEIVVTVAAAGVRDDRPVVRFAVRDTGIGIPQDKLETIFEEFGQADESTTRKYGGTGLGLAIARRLVRLMDGDLTVTSAVGEGTEFAFALPLAVDDSAPAPAATGVAQLVGRRVLVVDDSATNRRIVRGMLAAAGLQVSEAVDGEAGLDALERAQRSGTPYDLAILDAQMPGLDGFALGAAVRSSPAIADTRLLMLTSSGERGDGQRCRDLGINGYLTKPASRTDLLDAVSVVLGMAAAAAPLVVTQHSIAESRRRLQILLAEDNIVNQEVAATMLRKRGHDVDVVSDGRAAVEAAARKGYDLVLMDIQMPEMDGFEATRQIRGTATGRDLPIIALTAHALSGEREKCLAQGMSDYMTKPFKAHELFAVVEGRADAAAAGPAPEPLASSQEAPVDLEAFRREMREAGVEEAVGAILDTFVQSAGERIAALTAALAAGAAQEIKTAAHAFKSSAGTIGAKRLATLLQQVETAAAAGDVAQAQALGDRFAQESAAATDYVRRAREA